MKPLILASLTIFVCSLAAVSEAAPAQIQVGSLSCQIDQRVNGSIFLNLRERNHVGCMPIGPSRVFARRKIMKETQSALLASAPSKTKDSGFACEADSTYQLGETCELLTLVGYSWAEIDTSLSCIATKPAADAKCLAINSCRENVLRVLSVPGLSTTTTNLIDGTITSSLISQSPEAVVTSFNQLLKTEGCATSN